MSKFHVHAQISRKLIIHVKIIKWKKKIIIIDFSCISLVISMFDKIISKLRN